MVENVLQIGSDFKAEASRAKANEDSDSNLFNRVHAEDKATEKVAPKLAVDLTADAKTKASEDLQKLFEKYAPATDENCKVSAASKAKIYAIGIGTGVIAGPPVGAAASMAFCVSSIGDALLCGVVGFDKMLVGGMAVGLVLGPIVGGYSAQQTIKAGETACLEKKGLNKPSN